AGFKVDEALLETINTGDLKFDTLKGLRRYLTGLRSENSEFGKKWAAQEQREEEERKRARDALQATLKRQEEEKRRLQKEKAEQADTAAQRRLRIKELLYSEGALRVAIQIKNSGNVVTNHSLAEALTEAVRNEGMDIRISEKDILDSVGNVRVLFRGHPELFRKDKHVPSSPERENEIKTAIKDVLQPRRISGEQIATNDLYTTVKRITNYPGTHEAFNKLLKAVFKEIPGLQFAVTDVSDDTRSHLPYRMKDRRQEIPKNAASGLDKATFHECCLAAADIKDELGAIPNDMLFRAMVSKRLGQAGYDTRDMDIKKVIQEITSWRFIQQQKNSKAANGNNCADGGTGAQALPAELRAELDAFDSMDRADISFSRIWEAGIGISRLWQQKKAREFVINELLWKEKRVFQEIAVLAVENALKDQKEKHQFYISILRKPYSNQYKYLFIQAMKALGADALRPHTRELYRLLKIRGSSGSEVVMTALEILSGMKDKAAVEHMLAPNILTMGMPVRIVVARALAAIGGPIAVEYLIQVFGNRYRDTSKDWRERVAAMIALMEMEGAYAGRKAQAPLKKIVDNRDEEETVRFSAEIILFVLDGTMTVPAAKKQLAGIIKIIDLSVEKGRNRYQFYADGGIEQLRRKEGPSSTVAGVWATSSSMIERDGGSRSARLSKKEKHVLEKIFMLVKSYVLQRGLLDLEQREIRERAHKDLEDLKEVAAEHWIKAAVSMMKMAETSVDDQVFVMTTVIPQFLLDRGDYERMILKSFLATDLGQEFNDQLTKTLLANTQRAANIEHNANVKFNYRFIWILMTLFFARWLNHIHIKRIIEAFAKVRNTDICVLDLGCGSVAPLVCGALGKKELSYIGLDIDPVLTGFNRKASRILRRENNEFVAGLAGKLPLADESIDAVIVGSAEADMHEVRRILKPEGIVLLTCHDMQMVHLIYLAMLNEAGFKIIEEGFSTPWQHTFIIAAKSVNIRGQALAVNRAEGYKGIPARNILEQRRKERNKVAIAWFIIAFLLLGLPAVLFKNPGWAGVIVLFFSSQYITFVLSGLPIPEVSKRLNTADSDCADGGSRDEAGRIIDDARTALCEAADIVKWRRPQYGWEGEACLANYRLLMNGLIEQMAARIEFLEPADIAFIAEHAAGLGSMEFELQYVLESAISMAQKQKIDKDGGELLLWAGSGAAFVAGALTLWLLCDAGTKGRFGRSVVKPRNAAQAVAECVFGLVLAAISCCCHESLSSHDQLGPLGLAVVLFVAGGLLRGGFYDLKMVAIDQRADGGEKHRPTEPGYQDYLTALKALYVQWQNQKASGAEDSAALISYGQLKDNLAAKFKWISLERLRRDPALIEVFAKHPVFIDMMKIEIKSVVIDNAFGRWLMQQAGIAPHKVLAQAIASRYPVFQQNSMSILLNIMNLYPHMAVLKPQIQVKPKGGRPSYTDYLTALGALYEQWKERKITGVEEQKVLISYSQLRDQLVKADRWIPLERLRRDPVLIRVFREHPDLIDMMEIKVRSTLIDNAFLRQLVAMHEKMTHKAIAQVLVERYPALCKNPMSALTAIFCTHAHAAALKPLSTCKLVRTKGVAPSYEDYAAVFNALAKACMHGQNASTVTWEEFGRIMRAPGMFFKDDPAFANKYFLFNYFTRIKDPVFAEVLAANPLFTKLIKICSGGVELDQNQIVKALQSADSIMGAYRIFMNTCPAASKLTFSMFYEILIHNPQFAGLVNRLPRRGPRATADTKRRVPLTDTEKRLLKAERRSLEDRAIMALVEDAGFEVTDETRRALASKGIFFDSNAALLRYISLLRKENPEFDRGYAASVVSR
ncbi:MAG: class I SAM-dependent methyltransferase, partial [Candidatus Omnitrophota bacterium]